MADSDVYVILPFLLAIAGVAYLVWVRFFEARQPPPGPRRAEVGGRARTADTMPPTLRPQSEIPPKMAAKKDALAKASGRPPAPDASGPVSGSARAAEAAAAAAAKAKKGDAQRDTAPRLASAKASASSAKTKAAAKAPVSSSGPAAKADPLSGGTKVAKPVKVDLPSVPRIEVEEDEDVEPTKVGRAKVRAPIQPLVEKILFDADADESVDPRHAKRVHVHAVAQTDTGKRRKQNEDSHLLIEQEAVFIVADGMGGHRGGQVASKLAVSTIASAFERKVFEAAPHDEIPVEASELARAVQMANTAIFEEAKANRELEGMGTTLCALRFSADRQRLYVAHVGDSRCYRLRAGSMKQMTSDHTMADYGVTGPEGAHLSRALGVWPTVPIDIVIASPEVGDLYMLCSDGLTKMISDGTIASQLQHEEDPAAAVSRLVFFANSHGGKDNITVVLLRIVEPGWKPPRSTLPPPPNATS